MPPVSSNKRRYGRWRRSAPAWLGVARQALGRLRNEDAGFSLVETLAAFSALALVLVVLFAGLSEVTRGSREAEVMRQALREAQAKLDGLGVVEPLTPGESAGRLANGFAWHLQVREVRKGADANLVGASVEIIVSAPPDAIRARPVSLVTFKLPRVRER
jgi:type II secretory pathway pseudopilin PulG